MAALFKGNFTFFNSAVPRNIQLPRLINLGLLAILTAALFFVQPYLAFGYAIWVIMLALNVISIFIAIPREFYSRQMLNAMLSIPGLFINMFLLLFKLKNANKKFISYTARPPPGGSGGKNILITRYVLNVTTGIHHSNKLQLA